MYTNQNKFIVYFSISIIYKLLLDFSYTYYVSQYYQYMGFHFNMHGSQFLLGWVIYLVLIITSPKSINKISDFFISLLIFSLLTPLLSMYGLDSNLSIYPVFVSLTSIAIIAILTKTKGIKTPYIPIFQNSEKSFFIISLTLVVFLLFWFSASGAILNINFNLANVYDFRRENAELTNIGLLAYLNNWIMQIFSICLFSYGLFKKNIFIICFSLFAQIIFFGVSSHKTVLFLPLMVFVFYIYFKKTSSLTTIPLILGTIILASLIFFFLNPSSLIPSMFIRRVFFVPALLTNAYFDFFEKNPFVLWSGSILNPFMDDVYPTSISYTIGAFLGKDEMAANNGYISSGYAHAGFIGVLIYSLILGVYLKWLNVFSKNVPHIWLTIALMVTPFRSLILSSDLPTTFLTHGLIIATIMITLLRKQAQQ